MNKTRLKYEKPAMQVYELRKHTRLLQASKDPYEPTPWP